MIIISIILIILLLIFAMICKDERDTLDFKLNKDCFFPKWKWYYSNNWEEPNKLFKVVFTLFLDGRHWWEWWNELIKYYAISYVGYFVIGYNHWVANGIAIGSFALGGLLHSYRDGSLLRKT